VAKPYLQYLLFSLSVVMFVVGGHEMLRYDYTPGAQEPAPRSVHASTSSSAPRPLLLVFAHPLCPCTEATFAELRQIAVDERGKVDIVIYFVAEPGLPKPQKSSSWAIAAQIPDATVLCDEGGRIARRLGARTSGQVLLYSASGYLCFQGGITQGRGMQGESSGKEDIEDALTIQTTGFRRTAVFGCAL
jgi:hypothetical protein